MRRWFRPRPRRHRQQQHQRHQIAAAAAAVVVCTASTWPISSAKCSRSIDIRPRSTSWPCITLAPLRRQQHQQRRISIIRPRQVRTPRPNSTTTTTLTLRSSSTKAKRPSAPLTNFICHNRQPPQPCTNSSNTPVSMNSTNVCLFVF